MFRPAPPPTIRNATSQEVALTYRSGTFSYRVPVSNGRHTVRLTFVEPTARPGERIFDVYANGAKKLANLDISTAAGGTLTEYLQQFDVDAPNGLVTLEFKSSKGEAIVSAIQVH